MCPQNVVAMDAVAVEPHTVVMSRGAGAAGGLLRARQQAPLACVRSTGAKPGATINPTTQPK